MVNNNSGKNPIDGGLDDLLKKIKGGYPLAYQLIMKIYQVSNEYVGQIILDILQPNKEEEKQLRSKYPSLFLSKSDIDRLQKIIAKNKEYRNFIRYKHFFNSEEERSLAEYVADKIYDSMSDRDKRIYTPSDIQHSLQYSPIMNLGVIELPGQKIHYGFNNYVKQNISFFKKPKDIAARVLVRSFMEKGEMLFNGDLEGFLHDAEKQLREMGAYRK